MRTLTLSCAFVVLMLAGAAAADTTTVHIYNFDFSTNDSSGPVVDPTINLGDTIHWIWDEGFHSTTSAAGQLESWDSGAGSGPSYDHTFTNLGTFDYYCSVHGFDAGGGNAGGMSGSITVTPEPATMTVLGLGALLLARRRARRR